MKKRLTTFAFLCAGISCSTSNVDISSTPSDAQVELYNPSVDAMEDTGKTPFNLSQKEGIDTILGSSSFITVKISKKGYVPENVTIDRNSNPNVKLHVKLMKAEDAGLSSNPERDEFNAERRRLEERARRAEEDAREKIRQAEAQLQKMQDEAERKKNDPNKMADNLGRTIQQIYQWINGKQYASAANAIDDLLVIYPESHYIWDLKGSLHVLQKDVVAARTAFERSLQLNPENTGTRRTLASLSRMR